MVKKTIDNVNVNGKRVLVRVDFNVPIDADRNIIDETRIRLALPTLWYLLEKGASLILMSHLGRPKGQVRLDLTLKPIANRLHQLLGTSVQITPDCQSDVTKRMVASLKPRQVLLLENLRFHPEEEENDVGFSRILASFADIYVNDAFGVVHRAHASTEGVTRHVQEAVSGYLLEKELKYLQDTLAEPQRPFVAILGGAKVSDKIHVIRNLMMKIDTLLVGGGMSYPFLKAQGYEVGDSLLREDDVDVARDLLKESRLSGKELLLPVDVVVANRITSDAETQIVAINCMPKGLQGLDIGPKTRELFANRIATAGTVVWNGPLGVCEVEPFAEGTRSMVQSLKQAGSESGTITIVGGGDTAAAVNLIGLTDSMTHVSSGGGASLDCLAGFPLPGVIALSDLK